MRWASAISEHPIAADATGEVLAVLLDRAARHGTEAPSMALVLASGPHAAFLGEVSVVLNSVLGASLVVAVPCRGLLAPGQFADGSAALSVLLGWDVDATARADGPPRGVTGHPSTIIGFSPVGCSPVGSTVDEGDCPVGASHDVLRLNAWLEPAGIESMLLNGDAVEAVWIDLPGVRGQLTRCDGSIAVGRALTVTDVDGPHLRSLAGRPALDQLRRVRAQLDQRVGPDGRPNVTLAVHDDHGPVSVHELTGQDRTRGVLRVDPPLDLGAIVHFHERSARAATRVLRRSLRGVAGEVAVAMLDAHRPELFAAEPSDAVLLPDLTGARDVIGLVCDGASTAAGTALPRCASFVLTLQ